MPSCFRVYANLSSLLGKFCLRKTEEHRFARKIRPAAVCPRNSKSRKRVHPVKLGHVARFHEIYLIKVVRANQARADTHARRSTHELENRTTTHLINCIDTGWPSSRAIIVKQSNARPFLRSNFQFAVKVFYSWRLWERSRNENENALCSSEKFHQFSLFLSPRCPSIRQVPNLALIVDFLPCRLKDRNEEDPKLNRRLSEKRRKLGRREKKPAYPFPPVKIRRSISQRSILFNRRPCSPPLNRLGCTRTPTTTRAISV